MKRSILCIIITITLSLNICISSYAVSDNTTLQSNKIQYEEVSNDIKDLDIKIATLQSEISKVNSTLEDNKEKISTIENEIKTTEGKIETSKNEIKETEDLLSDRLREGYKSGLLSSVNYVIFLFESDGLSDLISRISSVQRVIELDNKMIKSVQAQITSMNKDIESLKVKRNSVKILSENIEKDLLLLKEKEKEIKIERNSLNDKKLAISNVILENEENLVSKQISIINSSSPSLNDLTIALRDLKGLAPQISTPSVKKKVNDAIKLGESLIKEYSTPPSTEGKPSSPESGEYKETYTMNASAYYGHTITAMGTVPVRDPNGISTVAVDPTVIPLGSKLYIPNYGYAIAADTGGIIKGMKIDLFMNSREEALSFGRRNITVHLIALPGEW